MALHEPTIRFETVGLDKTKISGTVGLKACVARTLSEINSEDCDAMPLLGVEREQRERLVHDERLLNLIREFNRDNKLIVAICVAPIILGEAGLLKGKNPLQMSRAIHLLWCHSRFRTCSGRAHKCLKIKHGLLYKLW